MSTPDSHPTPLNRPDIQANLDRCVLCGMCSTRCPTYQLFSNEMESPRGRVSLMTGLWQGRLSPSKLLVQHVDSCLSCGACEVVCPSKVPVTTLIDQSREMLAGNRPASRLETVGFACLASHRKLRFVTWLAWAYQKLGLQHLFRRASLRPRWSKWHRAEALLPPLSKPKPTARRYRSLGATRGKVALFRGCVAATLDQDSLHACIELLTVSGFAVEVPADQTCCGAVQRHAGRAQTARELIAVNRRAFSCKPADHIISLATGCTLNLRQTLNSTPAQPLPQVHDACELLDTVVLSREAGVQFRPLRQRVLVHLPCTLRNGLSQGGAVSALLGRIPDIELIALDSGGCCGAAGLHMLTHPEQADALREPVLRRIADCAPDVVVSSNVGCAMHLAAALRVRLPRLEVLHPVTLLWRQLDRR